METGKKLLAYARENRKDMTPEERKLWFLFLHKHPLKFKKQKVLLDYIVDFYCHQKKLVIEIDGGQHYEADDLAYDKRRTERLESLGLTVIRFTNTEINRQFDAVCQHIEYQLNR